MFLKKNASIVKHKITQSNTNPANSNCFQVLQYKKFDKKNPTFDCHGYTKRVDRIIFYKYSSFSICDVASQGMFPMP
jgi:hypothetical protein